MADFSGRTESEKRIAAELAKFGRAEMNDLAAQLGYPPDEARVPDSWWESHQERVAAALALLLTDVYLEAAREQEEEMPGAAADWATVQSEAAEWAREYAGNLAGSLTTNTRRALVSLLPLAASMTAEELTRRLRSLFGATRAATIAITETSRAVNAAHRRIATLVALTVATRVNPYYQTARDERVCPSCSPRDGRLIIDGVYPPLHPRCRCWVDWRLE